MCSAGWQLILAIDVATDGNVVTWQHHVLMGTGFDLSASLIKLLQSKTYSHGFITYLLFSTDELVIQKAPYAREQSIG